MTGMHPFATDRLRAAPVITLSEQEAADLRDVLSPEVTAFLPPSAQLSAADGDAQRWLDLQRADGAQPLCLYHEGRICGVFMVHITPQDEAMIGYLFAQDMWGQGLASEVLGGALGMLGTIGIRAVMGGVEAANVASARVLEKHGFVPVPPLQTGSHEATMYRKTL